MKLTAHRQRVLTRVRALGATEASPLRLHGPEFKAGLWLYENDLLGQSTRGFYPLT